MKNVFIIGAVALVLLLGGSWWSKSLQSRDTNTLSTKGLHWHAVLAVYQKGEKIEVPANIGIGAVHQPMHTHDTSGTIHMEFGGLVRKNDIALGKFFEAWGKKFGSFGSNPKMTVNGKENAELENYQMQDGDKIELRYE